MNLASYLFGIASALLALAVVIEMLRRHRLRERHAVWWIVAGVLALIIGIFPPVLTWAAGVVGIEVPTNLVFFISLTLLFLVCVQHSAELTDLEDKTRVLAENTALQGRRIDELEHAAKTRAAQDTAEETA